MKPSRIDYLLDVGAFGSAIYATIEKNLEIISWTIACIAGLVSLAFSLYQWYKEAKSDGKITKDELKEGAKIVKDHFEDKKK